MSSQYPGAYPAYKKDKTPYFRASLTFRGKHISLGSYASPQEAYQAYQEGLFLLTGTGSTLSDYSHDAFLSFEKWVILLNYKNNGIYIATPIYIRTNYFAYYFSPQEYFIFDIDDLFYYSSHKILRRGGHLFVNEYGMQFNILNRYGIHSFSVKDRDYRFINGDSYDYRYSNLEVISPYYGVYPVRSKEQTLYQAKIHINGDFIIGRYHTLEEAAIAYNKAVDLAKKAGVARNYMQNYIDGLSPAVYADIYSNCRISEKLLRYLEA